MSTILLEVCVGDAAGLVEAVAGGADRIELCAALDAGGLTPSAGLMALAAALPIPVYAMIRPRSGDFVFGAMEIKVMLADIDAARAAGLAGVVLGASLGDGRLDVATLRSLADHAAGLGLTLHRAFDLVPDFREALETAIALGFERILTSGGAKHAPEGADALAVMIEQAAGRIRIMPGSGVNGETVDALLARLAVAEIHSSCSVGKPAQDLRLADLGFAPPVIRRTDRTVVSDLKLRLKQWSERPR